MKGGYFMKYLTAFSGLLFSTLISGVANAGVQHIYSEDVVNESIDEHSWHYYQIDIENPSKLTVKLRKVSDDVDLYVSNSQKPTEDSYLCAPQKKGNSIETCRLNTNTTGSWFIGIHGKTDSDYQLSVQAKEAELLSQINTK